MTDLGNACASLPDAVIDELKAIAALHAEAGGLVMTIASWAGDKAGELIAKLPGDWRTRIDEATELALKESYRIAFMTQVPSEGASGLVDRAVAWADGELWHKIATSVTGALGGLGGMATTLLDLPVTTTLILRSIQQIAAGHGEDLADEQVRAQCIAVFGLGGPLPDDDQADVGLIGARLALSGKMLSEMLKAILPRYGIMVSQKAMAQATPLLGAVAGAALNPTFTGYYQTMAHVHFRLRKLERDQDPDQLRACFERIARARATPAGQVGAASA